MPLLAREFDVPASLCDFLNGSPTFVVVAIVGTSSGTYRLFYREG